VFRSHGVTVMSEDPDLEFAVAVIVTRPARFADTSPVAFTVARVPDDDAQTKVAFVTGVPAASNALAVSCSVLPAFSVASAGVTCTVAMGPGPAAFTVIVAVPDFPPLEAVMVAVPAELVVTSPVEETAATAVLLDDQDTEAADTTAPFASVTVAVRVVPCPAVNVVVDGDTLTLAIGTADTVTVAVPDCPPASAVMIAVPGDTAVTTPALDTVAMFV
jgi:hypothetical protein